MNNLLLFHIITGFKFHPIVFKGKGTSGDDVNFKMYITEMNTLLVIFLFNLTILVNH